MVHLHGSAADPASIILPGRPTQRLTADDVFRTHLRALMQQSVVIYLGFSLGPEAFPLRDRVAWLTSAPDVQRHILVIPADRAAVTFTTGGPMKGFRSLRRRSDRPAVGRGIRARTELRPVQRRVRRLLRPDRAAARRETSSKQSLTSMCCAMAWATTFPPSPHEPPRPAEDISTTSGALVR